jgi:hypothetical protein
VKLPSFVIQLINQIILLLVAHLIKYIILLLKCTNNLILNFDIDLTLYVVKNLAVKIVYWSCLICEVAKGTFGGWGLFKLV